MQHPREGLPSPKLCLSIISFSESPRHISSAFVPALFVGFAFSFACFILFFLLRSDGGGGRAGANYGQLHVEGSRTTTRRLGR